MGAGRARRCSRWCCPASSTSPSSTASSTDCSALAARHRVALVGGNITRSPGPLMIDVTAIGSVRPTARADARGRAAGRRGVRHRDASAARSSDCESLQEQAASTRSGGPRVTACTAEQRYLRPEPRVRAGLLLGRNRAATSCMDLSDGLADGLRQIAAASGVGHHRGRGGDSARRRRGRVAPGAGDDPVVCGARRRRRLRAAVHGSAIAARAAAGGQEAGGDLPITRIGVVTRDRQLLLRTASGERDLPAGFQHFR